MVQNWKEDDIELFNMICHYFQASFVPVDSFSKNNNIYFYTSSLTLVANIIKLDFRITYRRNTYEVDILFNCKSSTDCFETRTTIDDIVTSVIRSRLNDEMELNLSNFCNDPEFIRKKIKFYKLSLLANFKILMLRMGKITKILNLSNNKLDCVPLNVLNFFIRGEIIGLNLSNNNIPSIDEQVRASSKIERLWLEGNPLCEDMEPNDYIKRILVKFPRLAELDGVKINQHGILYPFAKHFIITPDEKTKMVVEKFLTLYFAHYDTTPRTKINMFYDVNAVWSMSTDFSKCESLAMPHYAKYSRNALNSTCTNNNQRFISGRDTITSVLSEFPKSTHDMNSFNVAVVLKDNKHMIIVLDGIYKEKSVFLNEIYIEKSVDNGNLNKETPENYIRFRRTFLFNIYSVNSVSSYLITREMFSISLAKREESLNSCQFPARNMSTLSLIDPDPTETYPIMKAFIYLTTLNKSEAERRLISHNWDIRLALKEFIDDIKREDVPNQYLMTEENIYSDIATSDEFD
ncbi:nuclear RNA export factor 1-like [Battus philenor]|uniref:nuclear RNA export factor 1-like n=1 Tax=Battus philenor TaxID=42288 RepID=UPI0035CF3318